MAKTAFILKGYPRLSETFIAQEILALERRGLEIEIYSLRFPTDGAVHPVHEAITSSVTYLPEYLYQEPIRVIRAWSAVRKRPGFKKAWAAWHSDLIRDPTPNRVRRFGQALVLAHEMPADIGHIHAHFIHTPGSVARYAGMIAGLPWSVSAHAKDIWTLPEWEKREKLADCAWAVTCTAANHAHLSALAPHGRVELVYHGLDFSRFPVIDEKTAGPANGGPVTLLSVGRAVDKKGYSILIEALSTLPAELDWRFVHIGGGPLRAKLEAQAAAAGIAGRIEWRGARTQAEVLAACREADLFVLASRISKDGDRDGLPNVLMEAQSQGLACLSTAVSAIPELIEDGETGLLVPPDDAAALADALARLISSPEERARLGRAGEARVRERFDMKGGIDQLCARFGLAPGDRPCA